MASEFTELAQRILAAGLLSAAELEKSQAAIGPNPDDVQSGRLTK